VIKSIIRWAGLVVRVGNRWVHIELGWGDLMEKKHTLNRHRWEDNIKIDIQDIQWTGLTWLWIGTCGGLL